MSGSEKWKLDDEEKEMLIGWIAEFPSNRAVLARCRAHNFPDITRQTVEYYRKKHNLRLAEIRERHRSEALEQGWARLENRIALLQDMLDDWASRTPQNRQAAELVLKLERAIAQELGQLAQRHKVEQEVTFEQPKTMAELLLGLETSDEGKRNT